MASLETGKAAPPSTENDRSVTSERDTSGCFKAQIALRIMLFAATLTSVVVMITGKQTELIPVPGTTLRVSIPAKYNHSPAFVFYVVALWIAVSYSINTTIASIFVMSKRCGSTKFFLYVGLMDVIMLGLVASATGAAGAVAYIGLKGNKHTRWNKICNVYDKFCDHVASSFGVAVFASVLLLLLSCLSIFTLYKKIR